MELDKLIRPDIRNLDAYTSARGTFNQEGYILLDANENPYDSKLNRYPDPFQTALKTRIAEWLKIEPGSLFLGNGSDEIIDLVIRTFCRPGTDNLVPIDPTYGMYEVLAGINQVEVRKAELDEQFEFRADRVLGKTDENTRLVFLCSPNNPTGNLMNKEEVTKLLSSFRGLVVVDEAYIDFSGSKGFIDYVKEFPNLIVLRTFSKAWGLAGIRLGYAIAQPGVVGYLNKVKYPYNVNRLTQAMAFKALKNKKRVLKTIEKLKKERDILKNGLQSYPFVKKIYPSQANFLLAEVEDAPGLLEFLKQKKIIVRDRSGITGCESCIRITVGTRKQNRKLMQALLIYEKLLKMQKMGNEK
jgi:histidinol-phosphate aminotransferase